jgi:hypothetical protein
VNTSNFARETFFWDCRNGWRFGRTWTLFECKEGSLKSKDLRGDWKQKSQLQIAIAGGVFLVYCETSGKQLFEVDVQSVFHCQEKGQNLQMILWNCQDRSSNRPIFLFLLWQKNTLKALRWAANSRWLFVDVKGFLL